MCWVEADTGTGIRPDIVKHLRAVFLQLLKWGSAPVPASALDTDIANPVGYIYVKPPWAAPRSSSTSSVKLSLNNPNRRSGR